MDSMTSPRDTLSFPYMDSKTRPVRVVLKDTPHIHTYSLQDRPTHSSDFKYTHNSIYGLQDTPTQSFLFHIPTYGLTHMNICIITF